MKKSLLFYIFLTFAIFFSSDFFCQSIEDQFDTLLMKKFNADEPGGTALVVKEGEVIYRKAFGKANLELDIDMKPEYIFRIGSITKQFTACAILGYVIEILSGKTYATYIDSVFFQPLGMQYSFYGSTSRIIKDRAAGYQKKGDEFENADFLNMTQP
jgi:CubicO group peptidase (beta-lactamase class C family)